MALNQQAGKCYSAAECKTTPPRIVVTGSAYAEQRDSKMVHTMKGRLPHIEISRLVSVLDDAVDKLHIVRKLLKKSTFFGR